ncbi:MAG: hypothetical protein V7661_04500, partial [Sulfitobacter sp.]
MTHLTSLLRKLPGSRWTAQFGNVEAKLDAVSEEEVCPNVLAPEPARAPSPFRKRGKAEPTPAERMPTVGFEAERNFLPDQKIRIRNKPVQYKSSSRALNNLSIPCPDPTREERLRDAHQNRALRLVRQEDWNKLITLITNADRDRALTPG